MGMGVHGVGNVDRRDAEGSYGERHRELEVCFGIERRSATWIHRQ